MAQNFDPRSKAELKRAEAVEGIHASLDELETSIETPIGQNLMEMPIIELLNAMEQLDAHPGVAQIPGALDQVHSRIEIFRYLLRSCANNEATVGDAIKLLETGKIPLQVVSLWIEEKSNVLNAMELEAIFKGYKQLRNRITELGLFSDRELDLIAARDYVRRTRESLPERPS